MPVHLYTCHNICAIVGFLSILHHGFLAFKVELFSEHHCIYRTICFEKEKTLMDAPTIIIPPYQGNFLFFMYCVSSAIMLKTSHLFYSIIFDLIMSEWLCWCILHAQLSELWILFLVWFGFFPPCVFLVPVSPQCLLYWFNQVWREAATMSNWHFKI